MTRYPMREAVLASQGMATRVRRWHTWPMLTTDTVGRHSCRAALIYLELWGTPRAEVLVWLLCHDLGELSSGDVPTYAKQQVPALKTALDCAEQMGRITLGAPLPELDGLETVRCKIADCLETWETALIERSMGNRYADCAMSLIRAVAMKIAFDSGVAGDDNRVSRFCNEKEASL